MVYNSFGENVVVTLFGESHAEAVGVSVSGFKSGFEINFAELEKQLLRRKTNQNDFCSLRNEPDCYELLCGIKNGITTGANLTAIFHNKDVNGEGYIPYIPRPSTSDYPAWVKYCGENVSGGGEFSARLTVGLVFAGSVARQLLKEKWGIEIYSHVSSIYSYKDVVFGPVFSKELKESLQYDAMPVICKNVRLHYLKVLNNAKMGRDSVGGCIETAILGVPPGIGSPLFGSIESKLALVMFGVPAVKGIEFGKGFEITTLKGSEANDPLFYDDIQQVRSKRNNSGGICGGLSTGMPIIFNTAFKPIPSIGKEQETINLEAKSNAKIKIIGKHDVSPVARSAVIVESVAALVILDICSKGAG
ncbi:MAG: chorismate synthase [Oscillospiraceae bacterium]|jgi:chorismate synthase|nr:chorismate synthase [Oscillospiraceae bacterium]